MHELIIKAITKLCQVQAELFKAPSMVTHEWAAHIKPTHRTHLHHKLTRICPPAVSRAFDGAKIDFANFLLIYNLGQKPSPIFKGNGPIIL
jgi:hypothetical protein